MKIVHAADLHIDSALRGLSRYEGAPVEHLRGATRRAFEALIELCLTEEASLLLIAGDLFDGDWRDYSTGLYFAAQLARLRKAAVQVVIVRGNHDAEARITRDLEWPDHVRVLGSRRPETLALEDLGVAVHGQSFPTREVHADLAERYPGARSGMFNIGLLHTSMGGRPGHEPYAPTTLEVLRSKGYDYWALGHVHTREVVSTEPLVIFPGNLQGRHARETGSKGATVLNVVDGRVVEHRHEALDVVRWDQCVVDASKAASAHDVVELARRELGEASRRAEGRLLAARVVIDGATRAHSQLLSEPERWQAQLRAASLDTADGEVWLEKIVCQTRPEREDGPRASADRSDALAQLVAQLSEAAEDPEMLGPLSESFADLRRALPPLLLEGPEALRLDQPDAVAALLPEVRELLVARLLGDTEDGA